MDNPKALVFAILAVGSTAAFLLVRNRPWEEAFLRRAVVTAALVKLAGCVLVYVFLPSLVQYSDARQFYLPQTLALLSGEVPNRDFGSSYSILFLPLLALPVKLWPSVGSIVLTMLVAETAMLALYVWRCRRWYSRDGWRVAFIYSWSPFSLYWVALSGHNGALIAFWVMLGIVLAEKGRAVGSGVAGAMAFLTTKLLGVLAWPALACYRREGWGRRTAPMVLSAAIVLALAAFGVDSFDPVRRELEASSTGNVWSLLGRLLHGADVPSAWPLLPAAVFALLFVPMWVAFSRRDADARGFDGVVAFAAAANLLFFVLSQKVFSYYLVMCLVFVVHTVVVRERHLVANLLVLAFLGSVSGFEEIHGWDDKRLVVMEGLRIASYAYLLAVCFAASFQCRQTMAAAASSPGPPQN